MEAKPIAVVYLPHDVGNLSGILMTWDDCHKFSEQFSKEKPDYYWMFLLDANIERVELKVFYEKDFEEIQYEELKKLITQSIEQSKK